MRLSMLARALAIAVVAVVVLLPIRLISGKISERQARAEEVIAHFAHETSGPQLVVGPLLAVTCEETFTEERKAMRDGKFETLAETRTRSCPTAYFAPRTFNATASMPVQTRYRGIYSIRLFHADVELNGEFEWPAPPSPDATHSRAWKQVYIVAFVQDPRGIKSIASNLTANLVTVPGESALAQFPIREPLGVHASRKAGTSTPLLALSEHVAAASAYAISAATCVVLLTYYLRYPLGSLPRTSAFLVLFVALHASVYALLMSEDHALLMGSAMVFLVLAIAMIATRKVDWTALSARVRAPA